jgi:hypothetical protein
VYVPLSCLVEFAAIFLSRCTQYVSCGNSSLAQASA